MEVSHSIGKLICPTFNVTCPLGAVLNSLLEDLDSALHDRRLGSNFPNPLGYCDR